MALAICLKCCSQTQIKPRPVKRIPPWLISFSLMANGLFLFAIVYIAYRQTPPQAIATNTPQAQGKSSPSPTTGNSGKRLELSYEDWVALLRTEAQVVVDKRPDNLAILMGDSLSQWFPPELLPKNLEWLNQGISGEGTFGLLRRLKVIDRTEPQLILVMIGINDLIRGESEETLVANQLEIVRSLKQAHPNSKIILQSILPHSDEQSTWERRDRLLAVPNPKIQKINQRLQIIAKEQKIYYLDLYPLFSDAQGKLKLDLTTDGLHLNPVGYQVWSIALKVFLQVEASDLVNSQS
jgi:lysophospholipase L1-like esterase